MTDSNDTSSLLGGSRSLPEPQSTSLYEEEPYNQSPSLDAILGCWIREFRYHDTAGNLVHSHKSRISQHREHNTWIQRNEFIYDDGMNELFESVGNVGSDGVLTFDTTAMKGVALGTDGIVLVSWTFDGGISSRGKGAIWWRLKL